MVRCGEKVSNTCTDKTKAPCVAYEAYISLNSTIEGECDITIEDTTEDLYKIADSIHAEIDNSELGEDYITYANKKTNTVLLQHEEELGNLNDKINTLQEAQIDITEMNLDFRSKVDACGNEPTTVKQFFQFLIDNL